MRPVLAPALVARARTAQTLALALVALALAALACSREPRPDEAAADPPPSAPAAAPSVDPTAAPSGASEPLSPRCTDLAGVALWTFPRAPAPGERLTVVAVADEAREATLELLRGDRTIAESDARRGATPFFWHLEVDAPEAGAHTIRLKTGEGAACGAVEVGGEVPPRPAAAWSAVWPIERAWSRATENLYSAWIEKLFDAPLDEQPVWNALHEVLRDRDRNFLYEHLGEGEDDPKTAPRIEPDCADLPYTLRAYFAFKLGLPFGWSSCTRGSSQAPPTCQKWRSSQSANDGASSPTRRIGNFLRVRLANGVHSGTVRVRGEDDRGDFYPVRLDARSLAPGTVFADPYGHILVIVRRIPQRDGSGGVLLAVDGQPDNTISRRRFWRGNFLFASDPVYGGPGFKRFRPVVMAEGGPRPLDNAAIAAHPDWGDYGLDQYQLDDDGFYDAIEAVVSPEPRDPELAFLATMQALEEQVKGRVVSVDNGVAYKKTHPGLIDMPDGAEIFETSGAWEDYSTPSRDMRLLIAIDVVRRMPQRVAAQPRRWAMPAGVSPKEIAARLEALLDTEAARRRFTYTRSDGSPWELRLADVLERAGALEVAYNPNDCPEKRWGAPEGSEERATCRAEAPATHRAKMDSYRGWFRDRRRPPRP